MNRFKNAMIIAGVACMGCALPQGAVAQVTYYGPPSLVIPYYQGANTLYQQQMRRRGVDDPGMIGSPRFFRRNFPSMNWDDYSRMTGGVFVRPRHCYGPYC